MPVVDLGRVSIMLVIVSEVVVRNERGGIVGASTSVTLHRRIGGSTAKGGRVLELHHAPIHDEVSFVFLFL